MRKHILIRRYGQGLINALSDEAEFQVVLQELRSMAGLFFQPGELRDFLANPFIVKAKKARAIQDVVARTALSPKAMRFLFLLVEKNRLDILEDVVELAPELWNERLGRLTCEVGSAVPLTEAQKRRLQERLEALEGRPVSLKYRLEPALIGGLTVRKGNTVYDVSLRGHLARLREIIIEG